MKCRSRGTSSSNMNQTSVNSCPRIKTILGRFCLCCCIERKVNVINPKLAIAYSQPTQEYRIEPISQTRSISILYCVTKLPADQNAHLNGRTQSPKFEAVELPLYSNNTSKHHENGVKDKSTGARRTSNASNSIDGEVASPTQGKSTVVVSVDVEVRPRTTESNLSGRLSLPPIIPLTNIVPIEKEKKVVDDIALEVQQKSSKHVLKEEAPLTTLQKLKRVQWNLGRKSFTKQKTSAPVEKLSESQANQLARTDTITTCVNEIEHLPNEPAQIPSPTTKYSSERVRSAKSTLGEVWHHRQPADISETVIFFLHGVGGCALVWMHQINYFSKQGFEIVAFEMAGHGRSPRASKSRGYEFKALCADFLLIFDRYAKKKNIVIAHSYGASFGAVLAKERPNKLTHLIMISGGGPVPLGGDENVFTLPLIGLRLIRPIIDRAFKRAAFALPTSAENFRAAFGTVPTDVLKYTMLGQTWSDGDVAYHALIRTPTMLIYGSEDKLVDLDETLDMQKTIPSCRLEVLEQVGHMPMLEAHEQVNQLIDDFIQIYNMAEGFESRPQTRASRRLSMCKQTKILPHLDVGI